MLKQIGTEARKDLEMLFGTKVFLQLFVKVKEDWRNSGFMLKRWVTKISINFMFYSELTREKVEV